jgi:hypothetical protein
VAVVAPSGAAADRFRRVLEPHCRVVPVVVAAPQEGAVDSGSSSKAEESVQDQLDGLLRSFAVDVVIVAPACKDAVRSRASALPESWKEILERRKDGAPIDIDRVVLEAKPADALAAVLSRSWIREMAASGGWALDDAR